MTTQRKQYSAEFKARVAMEALKGHKTMNELLNFCNLPQHGAIKFGQEQP